MECAAIQDVLVAGKALDEAESRGRKRQLDRMTVMVSRLGGRGYQVQEGPVAYGDGGEEFGIGLNPVSDFDRDFDFDPRSDWDYETLWTRVRTALAGPSGHNCDQLWRR